MGTRADFYIGRGKTAQWVCSIAWDGYPSGIPKKLLKATTQEEFAAALKSFTAKRTDVTLPADGWPWPWNDSRTTDYAYAFDDGKVWASAFGYAWFDPLRKERTIPEDAEKVADFPDMSSQQNVTLGERSGVIVYGIG